MHVYGSFSQPWYKKVRYACVYLVLLATDQAKAVGELTQHVRETTSEVGETTVNPTEHTEGACIWLTSALIGELGELRDNLTLMFAIQCFFSSLGRQFLYHYLSSVSRYFIAISLQACNRPQQTPACQTHLWNHSTIIEKGNTFLQISWLRFYFLKNGR